MAVRGFPDVVRRSHGERDVDRVPRGNGWWEAEAGARVEGPEWAVDADRVNTMCQYGLNSEQLSTNSVVLF